MRHSVRNSSSYRRRGRLLVVRTELCFLNGSVPTHESHKNGHHDNKLDSHMFDDVNQRTEDNDSSPHTEPNSSLIVRSNGRQTQRKVNTHGCPGFSLPACYTRCIYHPMANRSVFSMSSCNLTNSRNLRRPYDCRSKINHTADGTNDTQHRKSSDVLEYVHGYKCIGRLRESLPEAEYD